MIEYRVGDVTAPHEHPAILAHVCNDVGAFGKGVAGAIAHRWPHVRARFLEWHHDGHDLTVPYELGRVGFVTAEPRPDGWTVVANMVAQRGLPSRTNRRPLDLSALETCLQSVARVARGDTMGRRWTVVMPRIGTGYGGHTWTEVEPIMARTLHDIPVVVYDLPPKDPGARRLPQAQRGPTT